MMTPASVLRSAWDILMLKESTMRSVAKDKDAFRPALMILALVSFLSRLGYMFFPVSVGGFVLYRPDFFDVLLHWVVDFGISVAGLYVLAYLASLFFNSTLEPREYVQIMGFAAVIKCIAFVPQLALIPGIWLIVVMWVVFQRLAKLQPLEVLVLIVTQAVLAMLVAYILV